jgi:hypothetical protein
VSIGIGVVGLFFAWLLVTHRGHALVDRRRARHPRHRKAKTDNGPSWVERRLSKATIRIAFVVGAAINLPGPFYLLALGDLATNHSTVEQAIGIVIFNAIMFLLLKVPLGGYRIVGALVGLISIGLLLQGLDVIA